MKRESPKGPVVGGVVDAHSASISVASLAASGQMTPHDAVIPILAALTSNNAANAVIATGAGSRGFACISRADRGSVGTRRSNGVRMNYKSIHTHDSASTSRVSTLAALDFRVWTSSGRLQVKSELIRCSK